MNTIINLNGKYHSTNTLYKKLNKSPNKWSFSFDFIYQNKYTLGLYIPMKNLAIFSQPSLFPLEKYIIDTLWSEESQTSISHNYGASIDCSDLTVKELTITFLFYNEDTEGLGVEVNAVTYDEDEYIWLIIQIITEIQGYTLIE